MLVEGMMFGKSVIGCAAGGMLEVVEDGVSGLLAAPGDAASLLAAIETLVSDPELRKQMGQAARVRYEQRFTAAIMVRDVEDFLKDTEARWCGARRNEDVA
jgi:glycosyltransferase involved in cell wall biosynthesis